MPPRGLERARMTPHRIAAGGIIIRDDTILLVRYEHAGGCSYLVGPGGALGADENVYQAVVRETLEETGLTVHPRRVLFIEDLVSTRFKMCKIWVLCDPASGDIQRTEGARAEGIVEAGWFTRDALADEVVYPSPVMAYDWRAFARADWQVQCLPSAAADF